MGSTKITEITEQERTILFSPTYTYRITEEDLDELI